MALRSPPVFAVLILLAVSAPRLAESAPSPLEQAQAAEAELLKDEAKLRLRHNLERLEKLFEHAAQRGSEAERAEGRAGRLRAARLLARWSGLASDRARAEKLASELDAAASTAASKAESAPVSGRAEPRPHVLDALVIEVEEGRILVKLPGLEKAALTVVRRELLGAHGPKPRLYFDLRPLVAQKAALVDRPIDDARVEKLRVGQMDESTVRFVFDLKPGPSLAAIQFEAEPGPSFVLLKPESAPEKTSPPLAEVAPDREEALAQKQALERLLEEIVEAPRPEPEAPAPVETEAPSSPPASEHAPKIDAPLARSTREALKPRIESPVRIRRVVVDAGHGGKDVGAVGKRGTREKDVNLALALALGKKLEKELGVEVVYTRKKDSFVSLEKRTQIANAANADLFISVHSNANRNRKIRGIETYYLNTTSSRYANRLANRENRDVHDPELIGDDALEDLVAEEEEAPLPGGSVGRNLRLVLADLAMRSAAQESRRLAGYIQHTAVDHLQQSDQSLKDLGVKKALFFVLLGVRMPAVLVESGFLSHEEEERQLADAKYRDRLATAIAQGVRRYVEERNEIAARF